MQLINGTLKMVTGWAGKLYDQSCHTYSVVFPRDYRVTPETLGTLVNTEKKSQNMLYKRLRLFNTYVLLIIR